MWERLQCACVACRVLGVLLLAGRALVIKHVVYRQQSDQRRCNLIRLDKHCSLYRWVTTQGMRTQIKVFHDLCEIDHFCFFECQHVVRKCLWPAAEADTPPQHAFMGEETERGRRSG